MKISLQKSLGTALLALAISGPAAAIELTRAETSAARVNPPEPVRPYLELAFNAEINRLAETGGELVVSWEDAGGIDPTPFLLRIPAECFVRGGGSLLVRNHRACGVTAELTGPSGQVAMLPVFALSAVLTEVRGFGRLAVSAAIGVELRDGDLTSVLLGSIGGARQTVIIGDDSGSLVPNDLTVLGFNPQPEPPPLDF